MAVMSFKPITIKILARTPSHFVGSDLNSNCLQRLLADDSLANTELEVTKSKMLRLFFS